MVILYHRTSFGTTERNAHPEPLRSVLRARAARERVLPWLDREELPGLVLTGPGPVSWLTGGLPPPVDRSAGTDLVWAVVSGGSAALITTEVEADRIAEEYRPATGSTEAGASPETKVGLSFGITNHTSVFRLVDQG